MASSADTKDAKLEEAKDAMAGIAQEGAHRQVHEHDTRARKPRLGNMGVRQSWNECVGESHAAAALRGPHLSLLPYGGHVCPTRTRYPSLFRHTSYFEKL